MKKIIFIFIAIICFAFVSCPKDEDEEDEKSNDTFYTSEYLIFSDEFNGTTLDTTKWNELPVLERQGRSTWMAGMVEVSGGYLHIKFRRDPELGAIYSSNPDLINNWIRSGGIRTRSTNWQNYFFRNSFGYYEARIKFPVVRGTWGAFWLMSPTQNFFGDGGINGTEIDIVESIRNELGRYNAALHWDGYVYPNHKNINSSNRPVNIYDGEFHIFALEWTPTEYIFYVDGIEFWRVVGGTLFPDVGTVGINQTENYIKLSVEGADWAGTLPSDFTEDVMLVDYVRVYSQKPW